MNGYKRASESSTIIASVVAILAIVFRFIGVEGVGEEVLGDLVTQITDVVFQISAIVASVTAIIGRIRATKRIT